MLPDVQGRHYIFNIDLDLFINSFNIARNNNLKGRLCFHLLIHI
jgi:hypothetical protein